MSTANGIPTLAHVFSGVGNIVVPNGDGYRSSHLPVHGDRDGHAVVIHTSGWWQCWSCQERGGLVKAVVSLYQLPSLEEGEAWLKTHYPLTSARLAEDKGLPLKALQAWGVEDVGPGLVEIPYHDINGFQVIRKLRKTYTARLGSVWPKKTRLLTFHRI